MNSRLQSCSSPTGEGNDSFPIPLGRSTGAELDTEVTTVSKSAIVDGLLGAVQGLMAVLNENRQLLAINDSMLQTLGATSLKTILGLRLGEAVHCIHAQRAPGGCGTSEFCPTCGAAIAQVLALAGTCPAEQLCAIEIPGDEGHNNLFFRVRASPLKIGEHRYILLFLQDVSLEQRAAMLEQTFLHDLRNTAMGLSVGSELLADSLTGENSQLARDILLLSDRLTREIELQRCLAHSTVNTFKSRLNPLSIDKLFDELERSSRHHPAQAGRVLEFTPPQPDHILSSDLTILHRILYNMVINALEASAPGGVVKISAQRNDTHETFSIWNAGFIPPEIARRIFQRNFSTKGALGHGLGTYAMKLFGEKLLGGHVSFTTSPEDGTSFKLELPV